MHKKKRWERPVLKILIRENTTEAVLLGCKVAVPPGGPDSGSSCEVCSLCETVGAS